jgi:Na+/melibiose symporter-like transporter
LASLLLLSLPPWILAVAIPAALLQPLDWYSSHQSGMLQYKEHGI